MEDIEKDSTIAHQMLLFFTSSGPSSLTGNIFVTSDVSQCSKLLLTAIIYVTIDKFFYFCLVLVFH